MYTSNLVFPGVQSNLKGTFLLKLLKIKYLFNNLFFNLTLILNNCKDETKIFSTQAFPFRKRPFVKEEKREFKGKTFIWVE
jgi:hypothetical protein